MTIWIPAKPRRTKFYLMIGLIFLLAVIVVSAVVFGMPNQIPSIPIEYGEPVPVMP